MTFQSPSRSLTTRDYLFITLVVILFLIVCGTLVFANLRLKQGGDFYVHWVAARGFVFDKVDPYSAEVPARTQQLVYGDPAKIGDKPYILDTPFQILLLYFPFSLLSDPLIARAIFTLILELALFALAILSLRLTEWETPRWLAVLFVIFAVLNFYSIQTIYEASPVLLLGLLYAGILYSLHNEMDEFAGALIAVSLYYWEVGAPFLFLVFLRLYQQKRTRAFAGFFMLSFILFFISFLLYPGWIIPFLRATVNNLRADFGFNIHNIFIHFWPAYGQFLAWIFTGSLIILFGYELSWARSGDDRRFYWASCFGLAIAPLLGFRTEMQNLAVLVIPLALIFAIVHGRWRRIGNWLTFLLMLIVFGIPWIMNYFFLASLGVMAKEINFLFLPLFTLVGLYWIRWWAIRPPRILSDLANHL
jgi:hypothetical protein